MTLKIVADDADDIEFEVKGKIVLSLTRKGLIYKNELVKDGGEVLKLMREFLGLAEEEVQEQAHQQVVMPSPSPQERLDNLANQKSAWLIVQSSVTGDDDAHWTSMLPADIPDWVQEAEVMSDLMQGVKVKADSGGLWYRAVHAQAPDEEIRH